MKLTEKVEAWLAKSNDFECLFQQFNLEFGPRPNFLDKLPPQVSMVKLSSGIKNRFLFGQIFNTSFH